MNFLSQTNAARDEQIEQKLEVEICEAVREYTELNQSVIQLTKIISDGLTHLKRAPSLPKVGSLRTTPDAEDAP